jgi:hypothetical protein
MKNMIILLLSVAWISACDSVVQPVNSDDVPVQFAEGGETTSDEDTAMSPSAPDGSVPTEMDGHATPSDGVTPTPDNQEETANETDIPEDPSNSNEIADCDAGLPWLSIPVRILFLNTNVDNLRTSLEPAEIDGFLDHVNTLWQQACIRFELESTSVVDATPDGEASFTAAVANPQKGAVAQALETVVAEKDLLAQGWNVVMIERFGVPASGVYVANVDTVFFAVGKPSKPTHPTILAHELGHALSLSHFDGAGSEFNIMHSGGKGNVEESIELLDWQIAAARDQAATGDAH